MAHSKKTREQAQRLYVNSSLTMKDVAAQVGIDARTLSAWIKDGNWDDIRTAKSVTRIELIKSTYAQLARLNEDIEAAGGVPNKQQSDAKGVLVKELAVLQREDPLTVHVEVLEAFATWLAEENLALAKQLAPVQLEYLNLKARNLT